MGTDPGQTEYFRITIPINESLCAKPGNPPDFWVEIRAEHSCTSKPSGDIPNGTIFYRGEFACAGSVSQEVHVSTVRVADDGEGDHRPEREAPKFSTTFGIRTDSENDNPEPDSSLSLRFNLGQPFPRWQGLAVELVGTWQSFEPDTELDDSGILDLRDGDLYTVDLNLVYRYPILDGSFNLLAFGGVGWSFYQGDRIADVTFPQLREDVEEGELTPSFGAGIEWNILPHISLDSRYVYRPTTSPFDDGWSEQIQVGLGFRFGSR